MTITNCLRKIFCCECERKTKTIVHYPATPVTPHVTPVGSIAYAPSIATVHNISVASLNSQSEPITHYHTRNRTWVLVEGKFRYEEKK